MRCALLGVLPLASLLCGQTPQVLFSSVFGGYGQSAAQAVSLDAEGSIFVAGYTEAADFPVTPGGSVPAGGVDAVVMKLAPGGSQVLWAMFLGGRAEDRALAAAPDHAGGVWVAGFTTSPDFPVTYGQSRTLRGGRDAFIARFSATGALIFCRLLGGGGSDTAYALASQPVGVWVAGVTDSSDFPTLLPYQALRKGGQEGFFARFSPMGEMQSSSYFGGSADDVPRAASLAADGSLILAGGTDSPDLPFDSGFRRTLSGEQDGFVSRIHPSGQSLLAGTYVGGSGGSWSSQETVLGVAAGPLGCIWVSGGTPSPDFAGAQPAAGAATDTLDGYVVQFDPALTRVERLFRLVGSQREAVTAVVVDAYGTLFATGYTTSPDLPVKLALQPASGGSRDAILLRWPLGAPAPDLISFWGGRGADTGQALATANGQAVLAGVAESSNFPLQSPLQSIAGSAGKMFVTLVGSAGLAGDGLRLGEVWPNAGTGGAQAFVFSAESPQGPAQLQHLTLHIGASSAFAEACTVRYQPIENIFRLGDSTGSFGAAVRPGTQDTAFNGVCRLLGQSSSAAFQGTRLQAGAALVFSPAFAGSKNVYLSAAAGSAVGPAQKGTWEVPAANSPPAVVGLSTPVSPGPGGLFQLQVADAQGPADVRLIYTWWAAPGATGPQCLACIDAANQWLYLLNNDSSGWLSGRPGSGDVLENAVCRLLAASSSTETTGSAVMARFDVRFKSALNGPVKILTQATDSSGSAPLFRESGAYTISAPAQEFGVDAAQISGSGHIRTFRFGARHPSGPSSIRQIVFSVSSGTTLANACSVRHVASSGQLQLATPEGIFSLSVRPGTPDTATNGLCTLYGAGSRILPSADRLEVDALILFHPLFAGKRKLLLSAEAETATPLTEVGEWLVPSTNSAPYLLPPAIASQADGTTLLRLTAIDAQGAQDPVQLYGLVGASLTLQRVCLFAVDLSWKALYLLRDDASAWDAAWIGQDVSLENSQCRIPAARATLSKAGFQVDAAIAVHWKSGTSIPLSLFGNAVDLQANSGWVELSPFSLSQ